MYDLDAQMTKLQRWQYLNVATFIGVVVILAGEILGVF
jgi:hypothetical protein